MLEELKAQLASTSSALRCSEDQLQTFTEAVSLSTKTQHFMYQHRQQPDFLFLFRDLWVSLFEDMNYYVHDLQRPYHRLLAKIIETNAYVMMRRMTVQESLPALVGAYHLTEYCYAFTAEEFIDMPTLEDAVEQAYDEMRRIMQYVDQLIGHDVMHYSFQEQIVIAEMIADTEEVKEIAEYSRIFQQIVDEVDALANDTYGVELEMMQHQFFVEGSPETVAEYLKKKRAAEALLKSNYHENVLYVPFHELQGGEGPYIICVEQTDETKRFNVQTKALVLLIAKLAQQRGRDLCVIPFADDVNGHYYFEKGNVSVKELIHFMHHFEEGHAQMLPALSFALTVIRQNEERKHSDIIFITEGKPIDEQKLLEPSYQQTVTNFLREHEVDVTALILNEQLFDATQYWFLDHIYFAEDLLQ